MNNQTVVLLIAIGVLIAVLFVVPSSENFVGDVRGHIPNPDALSQVGFSAASNGDKTSGSSVDCKKFPDDPACKPPPPVSPVDTGLKTCVPSDGQWSTRGTGLQGRSTLASPCCQPPKYELAKANVKGVDYKTCDDNLDKTNAIEACVAHCCSFAASQANNYDTSWYPMARCACSLWCYNQDVPHFAKYGTAVHYISGDIAEATTSDDPDFIGSGGDFSGA